MKNILFLMSVFFLITGMNSEARANLDDVLANINVQARVDINGFENDLSSRYNRSLHQIQRALKQLSSPADLVLCLQLSNMSHRDLDTVMRVYEKNRGKGWGVTAQELGIKPGSAEFHALKQGNFGLTTGAKNKSGTGQAKKKKGKGKEKSKGKANGHKKH
ncbi:MAG: hypothetical protein ABFR63_06075 [Thermodesulfobacteriota bacterium]